MKICELFNLYAGGDLDKENYSKYQTTKYCFPIYSNSLTNKGLYGYTSRTRYKEDSITITGRGTIGVAEFRKDKFDAIIRLLVLEKKTNNLSQYITYYINHFIKFNVESTGVPQLTVPQIKNIEIKLPDLSVQKNVVEYLTNIEKYIKSLEKLIEKKKLIKQGVMQELLTGKKRLPGYNGKWIKKELQELGDFTSGGVDKKSIPGQKSVKLLNFLDVYHRDFIFKNELYHIVTASDAQIKKCTLKKGDLFFTPSSELQTDLALSAVVMEDCPGCVYSYHITRFRFKDNFDIKFKSYMFNNKEFLDQASLIAEGSGKRYVVNLSKFKTLTITYPTDIKEQSAIAEILWDLDQEINSLEKDLGKYKNIKQGMMEQLLTGKIRVV